MASPSNFKLSHYPLFSLEVVPPAGRAETRRLVPGLVVPITARAPARLTWVHRGASMDYGPETTRVALDDIPSAVRRRMAALLGDAMPTSARA